MTPPSFVPGIRKFRNGVWWQVSPSIYSYSTYMPFIIFSVALFFCSGFIFFLDSQSYSRLKNVLFSPLFFLPPPRYSLSRSYPPPLSFFFFSCLCALCTFRVPKSQQRNNNSNRIVGNVLLLFRIKLHGAI